jgi:hypothetical protein
LGDGGCNGGYRLSQEEEGLGLGLGAAAGQAAAAAAAAAVAAVSAVAVAALEQARSWFIIIDTFCCNIVKVNRRMYFISVGSYNDTHQQ